MSTRSSVFVSLLAWVVFLAFGSGNTQFHSSPVETPPTPPPQLAPMPASFNLDVGAILDQAQALGDKAEWLAVTVRQRKCQGDSPWSSEGTLQLGPNGCCRLELAHYMGATNSRRVVVVSDGKVLARVTSTAGAKPKIESWPLPADAAPRRDLLAKHACGGPAVVLAQARARGVQWTAQPAALGDHPGLALTGLLAGVANDAAGAAKNIRLFLDAETLGLVRAEWWSDHPDRGGALLFEIEFTGLRVNQPLSLEECGRVFSYRMES